MSCCSDAHGGSQARVCEMSEDPQKHVSGVLCIHTIQVTSFDRFLSYYHRVGTFEKNYNTGKLVQIEGKYNIVTTPNSWFEWGLNLSHSPQKRFEVGAQTNSATSLKLVVVYLN